MQSVSSRIWTRVAVSISYDDNHYTTGTSNIQMEPFSLLITHIVAIIEKFILIALWKKMNLNTHIIIWLLMFQQLFQ